MADADGCILRVHVRPGARHDELAGFHGTALCLRVRARPVEGAANAAVQALIARLLDVPPRDVVLESGARGREKRWRVAGLDAATVRARLAPRLRVDRGEAGG
ncbi:MAG: DUF167 domain-containing protein [bacterium]|nr:DUF167 domain-containing protein [bacterium]